MNKTNTEVRKSTHPFFHHCLAVIKDDWLGPRCAICLMSTTSVLWEPDRRVESTVAWWDPSSSELTASSSIHAASFVSQWHVQCVCATPIYIRILTTGFVHNSTLIIILLPPHTKLPTATLWKIRQNRSRKYQHYYPWSWSN